MKEISKKEIEKKIREEYEDARKFVSQGKFRYYKMMLDLSDGSIWADVFLDCNDWKVYHSESIIQLSGEDYFATVGEIESAYVESAIRSFDEHGWIIK